MTRKSVMLTTTRDTSMTTFYRGYLSYLRQKGWDVTVVASSTGKLEEFASMEGVRGIDLPMERNPSPIKDALSLLRWIRILRLHRPNVLVAATPKASLLALTAARLTACPTRIYQVWGLRFETTTGWHRILFRTLERVAATMATDVICNSRSLASVAEASGVTGGHAPRVLGDGSSHGVDLEYYSRDAQFPELPETTSDFLKEHAGFTVIGFVGRITPDKGVEVLLEALQVCHDRGLPIACVVVGSAEDGALSKRLIDSESLYPMIHFAGAAEDPRPYFAAFDVLCLPSRREGFPNVVLEAAAMGIPAIVTDSTGTVDSVQDGITGRIVTTDDTKALAQALEHAALNHQYWRDMGVAARSRAEAKFSKHRLWRLQEEAIQETLLAIAPAEDR
ncbi:glycosyltransferase family 4 protein [Citricoccus nitrophenolicus]|uniref:D-inositol 3-phosphate glycosyltransferase n=1 Tax=Citricoccus nitrophenolicus TaxID=863575 RepID=A0ABV0IJ73_9MICC